MKITPQKVIFGPSHLFSMNYFTEEVDSQFSNLLAPWTGRSIPELLNNIYKNQLQFPTPVVISD